MKTERIVADLSEFDTDPAAHTYIRRLKYFFEELRMSACCAPGGAGIQTAIWPSW